MRKKNLIVANWKMNPETVAGAKTIFQSIRRHMTKLKRTEVVICPSFPHISLFNKVKEKNLSLGAQNCHEKTFGAYTGEVSASQLKDLGAKYIILGHSERREQETDEEVNLKLKAALAAGLIPILCVGEKTRDKDGVYLQFIKEQLLKSLNNISKKDLLGIVVAYEPIWAIGKGNNALNATDMHEMSIFIRKILSDQFGKDYGWNICLLYGGSVEPDNALTLMEKGEIQGFLVGHASLVPSEFKEILESVDSVK